MAQCHSCGKTLQGSWNMTTAGPQYERTGRYLGIGDGYFLYSGQPNWVYCYCYTCWQRQILSLPFITNPGQYNTSVAQENENLRQQLTASQSQCTALQKERDTLRDQLTNVEAELKTVKENLNMLEHRSSIGQLRDILKKLTDTQKETLRNQTSFPIDTIESLYTEEQIKCSQYFSSSTALKLQESIDQLVQTQTNTVNQRKQAKQAVLKTLSDGGVPQSIIDLSIKPLEAEITEMEMNIMQWNELMAALSPCCQEISEHAGKT